jgi:formate dehydrogenase subunit delta
VRIERLVAMANDIGRFFEAESDPAAAARNIANHLQRYWDPRMRRQIVGHYRDGGAGLRDAPRAAIGLLTDETR